MTALYKNIERVLIDKKEIAKKIKELADLLSADYEGKRVLMVGILKGSVIFISDLIRQMSIPVELDFMAISSYGFSMRSSGEVRVLKDLDKSVENKHVVVVEDIIDTGLTLNYLKKLLSNRALLSLKTCCLLDKIESRRIKIDADYIGFRIPNLFVVGYGLDYDQAYRNLPEICVLKSCSVSVDPTAKEVSDK
jgi:hypoxanthine phosphoribosyltransferase